MPACNGVRGYTSSTACPRAAAIDRICSWRSHVRRYGSRRRRTGRRYRLRHGGELADRLAVEHVPGGQVDTVPAGLRDDLDAENRVAAEGEEVVVDTDPCYAKDVGQIRASGALGQRARRDVAGVGPAWISGAGSMFRSIFPCAVSGSSGSVTYAVGSCSRAAAVSARRVTRCRSGRCPGGHHITHQVHPPVASAVVTTASAIPSWRVSAASISPGSIR